MMRVKETRERTVYNVIAFGAGLNSSAMIPYLIFDKKQKIDAVIFSDTGNEHDYTYDVVKYFQIWCKKNKIPFLIAKSHLDKDLYSYCIRKKIIPSRMTRQCTKNFKINPMRKTLRQYFKIDKNVKIRMYFAITVDESHRVKDSNHKYLENAYPFVDDRITREGCKWILEKHQMPIPSKSGCWFCPFHKKDDWLRMFRERPDLFSKSMELEQNGRHYPKELALLWHQPLITIKNRLKNQALITDFHQDQDEEDNITCDVAGNCFL